MNYPWGHGEQEFWADHLDWSRLKRARFEGQDLGAILFPRVPTLEEVTFEGEHNGKLAFDGVQKCPTKLRSLTMPCLDMTALVNIPGLGTRLQRLSVHSYEDTTAWKSLESEDDTIHDRLVELCPLLEMLEIDMHRNGSWPYAKLQRLAAGLPYLRDLTVWFALGNSDKPTEPKVTVQVVAEMFGFLKQHSRSLEKVTVHSGAPSPFGLGYPSVEAFWPGSMEMTFICELAERDDERIAGHFYITSKELSSWRLRDDQLHEHIARFTEGSQDNSWASGKLKVAIEGPVPFSALDSDWYY